MPTLDWAKVIATAIAAAGLFLTAFQMRRAARQRGLDNVADALLTLYRDADLADAFYQIEYSDFRYSSEFHGSKEERNLDRLLTLFDSLAKRRRLGLVQVDDLESVAYHYLVVYQNPEVQSYFRFLDSWFDERRVFVRPFRDFRETGALLARHVSKTSKDGNPPRIHGRPDGGAVVTRDSARMASAAGPP